MVSVADSLKEDSADAIASLQAMGIEVAMLTGDNMATAQTIAKQIGIQEVHAELLPLEKKEAIDSFKQHNKVAMVGDGINDALALVNADVGMAIQHGSDIALDSADVVLMHSSLKDAVIAIRLSRTILRNIYENFFWAFAYNILLIPIAAGIVKGMNIHPMWGAAAMSLSSVFVCLNALRLYWFSNQKQSNNRKEKEMKKIIHIEGMMCQHCQATVEKALSSVDGVKSVEVSLAKKEAVIYLLKEVSDQQLQKAIEEKGYRVLL